MTSFTDTWNAAFEAIPAGSSLLSLGDDAIRDLKVAISERLEVDHSWAGDADDGEHLRVVFTDPLGSDPGAGANKGSLYTKDISAKVELFWEDEDANVLQLTAAGALAANLIGQTQMADNAIGLAELVHLTEGDLLIYSTSGVPAALGIGSNGEVLTLAAGLPVWLALPSVSTVAAGTALTASPVAMTTDYSQAHGLGAAPSWLWAEIVCTTGDLGYVAGDRVALGLSWRGDLTSASHVGISTDATVIEAHTGNNFGIVRADSNNGGTITAASWDLVITPYLFTAA